MTPLDVWNDWLLLYHFYKDYALQDSDPTNYLSKIRLLSEEIRGKYWKLIQVWHTTKTEEVN